MNDYSGYRSIIRIFSSHRWSYGGHRDGLHSLLSPTWSKGSDFEDLSISQAHGLVGLDNREMAIELKNRISNSDVLLAMAGMYANHSDWMKREIDFALALDVPIVPVVPWGQERLASTAVGLASTAPVRWNGQAIRAKILEVLHPGVRGAFFLRRARRAQIIANLLASKPSPSNTLFTNSPARGWAPDNSTPGYLSPRRR